MKIHIIQSMLKHRAKAVYVLVIALAIGYFVYSTNNKGNNYEFRLGLDLSGGSHLVYKADVSKIQSQDIGTSMSALRDVIERRINIFGVSEPVVQVEKGGALSNADSQYKIIVELPGISNIEEAVKAIGATPRLEFKLASESDIQSFNKTEKNSIASTTELENKFGALFKPIGLDGTMVSRASLEFNTTTNIPAVGLSFNSDGRKVFGNTTKDHVGDFIGIFLDGKLISYPVIREAITNGKAQISGNFTTEEAGKLVRDLNFGALPVPISLISTQTVGPSLGADAVNGGLLSGIIAFAIIAIFLIVWYRLPGFVAVVALAAYTIFMLAIFKLLPVTLTAAGIAGFILSIGMAVDANILIFERMKEELLRGRGTWDAMHEGFLRAWTSIRDSNISSIITAIILYFLGSTSVVIGFATVFFFGVVISMITAISVSRLFLYAIVPTKDSRISRFLISNGFRNRNK